MTIPMLAITHARNHALEEALKEGGPFESCGVVVGGTYYPCTNTHPDPQNYFRINPRRMLNLMAKGKIEMVFHSHPDADACPTKADMVAQMNCGHPYGIIPVITKTKSAGFPVMWGTGEIPELVGRTMIPGVTDCYSLIKDYYKLKLDIDIPDYPRDPQWWDSGEDLYTENFANAGFVEVDIQDVTELKVHDVIMMCIRSQVINHGAIYIGGDAVMHHYGERLSEIDEAGIMKWRKLMSKVVRHKSLMGA